MNLPLPNAEAARWTKLGRRWSITLAILLTINISLVAAAGWSYGQQQSAASALANAQSAAGGPAIEVPAEQVAAASSTPAAASAPATSEPPLASDTQLVSDTPEIGETPAVSEPPAVSDQPAQAIAKAPETAIETTAPAPAPPVTSLVIVNPQETGGVVHFLLNGKEVSLAAGEQHRLEGGEPRQLVFHRGDEFENVEMPLAPGVYVFSVTTAGWQLDNASDEAAASVTDHCPLDDN